MAEFLRIWSAWNLGCKSLYHFPNRGAELIDMPVGRVGKVEWGNADYVLRPDFGMTAQDALGSQRNAGKRTALVTHGFGDEDILRLV